MNKLKIIILTQEDFFFIPKNIEKLALISDIKEIVILDTKGALNNKTMQFVKWFGIWQVGIIALKVFQRKFLNLFDLIFSFKVLNGRGSVKMIAKKYKIPLRVERNVNSDYFYEKVSSYKPDVILSFSCPVVIKERLLNFPKHGIINVHGSYLPNYQGLLPSFWHLRNSEQNAGATVHYMSKKIDDGDIILQDHVDISQCKSMFDVMRETKLKGGELMVQTLKLIQENTIVVKENDVKKGNYYSWPQDSDIKEFKEKGYKFV